MQLHGICIFWLEQSSYYYALPTRVCGVFLEARPLEAVLETWQTESGMNMRPGPSPERPHEHPPR